MSSAPGSTPDGQAPVSQASEPNDAVDAALDAALATEAPAADGAAPPGAGADNPDLDDASLDDLLKNASFEDPVIAPRGAAATEAEEELPGLDLPEFDRAASEAQASSVDLLRDVELNVKIELGRSRMLVEDVLKLAEGSVVELDKLAGDPVDVFVNERLVARGEVLVLNDMFCVRINEIVQNKEDAQ